MTIHEAINQVDFTRFKFIKLVFVDQFERKFYEVESGEPYYLHEGVAIDALNKIDHKLGNGSLSANDKRSIFMWEATGTSLNISAKILTFTVVVPSNANQQLFGGGK